MVAAVSSFEADDAGAAAFIDVVRRARADDPRFIASPPAGMRKQLDAAHPMWRHVQRRCFVVAGRARCAAFVNARLNENGTPLGQIGMFECVDDDAGRAVLDAGLAWLKERGCTRAIGPMNGSTWHAYRFVVDWKDAAPLLLEPNNPLRYPALWEAHGWQRHATPYYSGAHDNAAVVASLATKHDAARAAGYHMEPVDLRDLRSVLKTMYELSLEIFAGNAFYSDITWDEFAALYDGVERLLEPSLVAWLRGPDGDHAGFAFGVPDHAVAAQRMRGDTGLLGKLRFVTAPKPVRTLVKTIGVRPAHRGKGLLSELYWSQAQAALAKGWQQGVVTLMAGDNRSFTGGRAHQTVVREYALFGRTL